MSPGAPGGRHDDPSPDRAASIHDLLADPRQPRLVFQPIVDLHRGVVAGYECLSRFVGPFAGPPDVWFDRAAQSGVTVELEQRVLCRALESWRTLPDDTFLSLNISPEALASKTLQTRLRDAGSLHRLVFEITEHSAVADYRELLAAVRSVRDAGGRIAVDDAGAGYASLRHILELRPDFVKLDRSLIASVDQDPAMAAVVQMLGDFASGIDSWVVAEGIERIEELDVLCSLGVPLAQGYLLGRPNDEWTTLSAPISDRLSARMQSASEKDAVGGLSELRPGIRSGTDVEAMCAAFDACPGAAHLALLDEHERPLGLLRRSDVERREPSLRHTVIVAAATPFGEAATRAMQRPEETRFDPIVCTLSSGRYFGIISLERLVTSLAR